MSKEHARNTHSQIKSTRLYLFLSLSSLHLPLISLIEMEIRENILQLELSSDQKRKKLNDSSNKVEIFSSVFHNLLLFVVLNKTALLSHIYKSFHNSFHPGFLLMLQIQL